MITKCECGGECATKCNHCLEQSPTYLHTGNLILWNKLNINKEKI